jgi:hypothetical protein
LLVMMEIGCVSGGKMFRVEGEHVEGKLVKGLRRFFEVC